MLPEAERPAVARALAKAPRDRWPSCRAFVEAVAAAAERDVGWRRGAATRRQMTRGTVRKMLGVGVAVVSVALGLGLWVRARSHRPAPQPSTPRQGRSRGRRTSPSGGPRPPPAAAGAGTALTPSLQKGDRDRSLADYEEAIRLDPKDAVAYYKRGLAHYEMKKYDRAVADYGEAIRLDPNYALAYTNRGHAYARQGRHRPRHRRSDRGDPARPEGRLGVLQPGARPPRQEAATTKRSLTTARRSGSTRGMPGPITTGA